MASGELAYHRYSCLFYNELIISTAGSALASDLNDGRQASVYMIDAYCRDITVIVVLTRWKVLSASE